MIPMILHQTSSKPLNWAERRLTLRARRLMPDWHYRMWNNTDRIELIDEYFPSFTREFVATPLGVIRADIARCLFLYKYGGVYFDTDYKFYKAPSSTLTNSRCVMGIEVHNDPSTDGCDKLGNAFLAAEPLLPFWLPFVESIIARYDEGNRNVVFLSGPHALTLFLGENPQWRSLINARPIKEIYPPFRFAKLTTEKTADTIGAHLCWGSWRSKSRVQRVRNKIRIVGSSII